MAASKTETLTLTTSESLSMNAFVAHPEKPGPGLIVLQEAFGVNEHIRDVTERFAAEGYLAIAPELFHRTGPGFEGSYTDFPAVMPHMQALTDDGLVADMTAAHAWLKEQGCSQVGAIGYCLGGKAAYLASATLPIQAAASYYGGGIAPGPRGPGLLNRAGDVSCPMLLVWGGLDAHIGPDAIRAVEDALKVNEKDYINVVMSQADHGFFCDARASYNPTASAQIWPFTLAFLGQHLHG